MSKQWLLATISITLLLAGCGSSPQEDFERRLGQAMRSPASDPTFTSPMGSLRRVAMSAANTNDTSTITPDQLFDWAEATYPQLFPSREKTLTWSNYQFRYYKDTDVYLAVENGAKVVALGKPTGGRLLQFGEITAFASEVAKTKAAFKVHPIELLDIEPLYAEICPDWSKYWPNNLRGLQHVIPVDLNGDARRDLLLFMWCSPVQRAGTYFAGLTPNRLVALVQTKSGVFENKTEDVFGNSMPQLDGASDCYVAHDFNKDGRVDIVFSAKREDGRQSAPPTVINNARATALMSTQDGRYQIERIGEPQWGECVYLLDNERGGRDIFLTGVSLVKPMYGNAQWRYDISWTLVQELGFGGNIGISFLEPIGAESGSSIAVVPMNGNPDNAGINIYQKKVGRWEDLASTSYRMSAVRGFVLEGSGVLRGTVVANVEGVDYFDAMFGASCQLRRPKSPLEREILILFNGTEITGGYSGKAIQSSGSGVSKLRLFSYNKEGGLQLQSISILNEKQNNVYPNRMYCGDINGDGFQDVVLFNTNFGGSNDVLAYLGNANGSLSRVRSDVFPASPPTYGHLRNYTFADMNGDGILDLVYFQIVGEAGLRNQILIYLGNRQLSFEDL